MSHIIDTMLAVFMLVLVMLFGTSIVQAQVSISEVKDCKEEIAAELKCSNYNPNVINECIRQAQANRFTITITLYRGNKGTVTYTSANASGAYADVSTAEIKIGYHYSLTCFGESRMHYIRGFTG